MSAVIPFDGICSIRAGPLAKKTSRLIEKETFGEFSGLPVTQGLADGDKPRPYKCASIQRVGAEFIPARTDFVYLEPHHLGFRLKFHIR